MGTSDIHVNIILVFWNPLSFSVLLDLEQDGHSSSRPNGFILIISFRSEVVKKCNSSHLQLLGAYNYYYMTTDGDNAQKTEKPKNPKSNKSLIFTKYLFLAFLFFKNHFLSSLFFLLILIFK
jgi:hypothetical protein